MSELLPSHIGPFTILKSIGKGGMGEVFLAFDPVCKREVALKKIRSDLKDKEVIKNRFIKEATITSQLAHPAIVPIYSIHEEKDYQYYIMPYLKGETLKECIRRAKNAPQEKLKHNSHEGSIASFLRIFISMCQAIGYAHSKGFLHRDLKPENIIIGKYGQVYILDWGLVKAISDTSSDDTLDMDEISTQHHNLTRPGKLIGTLAFMAPERVLGRSATISSDIYALGVIFYQILTLRLPFKRKTVKEFREKLHLEHLIDPAQMAPYRDVPPELSRIVKMCLAPTPSHRYATVDHLVSDLENYLEGQAEWFLAAPLDIHKKSDWEFQENVLIPEPIIISKNLNKTQWMSIMLSKERFSGNTQIKAKIKIKPDGAGIGFLLSVPEATERTHPTEGYYLWLSAEKNEPTKLFRSTVEVMELPEITLPTDEWLEICLRKVDRHIHFYLRDVHMFTYISYFPLTGTHVGLTFRDTHFQLLDLQIHLGSLNLQVSCLAVPDAFLAEKNYLKALTEYRRIGASFQGRAEGREGLFRAGIAILYEAIDEKNSTKKSYLFNQSLLEFEKLRDTPGAPLEYLGKALVYEAENEHEEEVKCFELGLRRYPNHPLLPLLEEQILFRLHNRYKQGRSLAFMFLLLILKVMPNAIKNSATNTLLNQALQNLESLYFIETLPENLAEEPIFLKNYTIQVSFWLNKPSVIAEVFDSLTADNPADLILMKNALFCLLKLGAFELVLERVPEIAPSSFALFRLLATLDTKHLEESFRTFATMATFPLDADFLRGLFYLFEFALLHNKPKLVIKYYAEFSKKQNLHSADSYLIQALLLEKDWMRAGEVFQHYPILYLNQENTLLHFLYGCWLCATEGKELSFIHFAGISDTPFPKTWMLASHFLFGKGIDPTHWLAQSFFFEKQELYKQLALYYHCQDDETQASYYQDLALIH